MWTTCLKKTPHRTLQGHNLGTGHEQQKRTQKKSILKKGRRQKMQQNPRWRGICLHRRHLRHVCHSRRLTRHQGAPTSQPEQMYGLVSGIGHVTHGIGQGALGSGTRDRAVSGTCQTVVPLPVVTGT